MHSHRPSRTIDFFLLGKVDFDAALALQRRLVYESGDDLRAPITVLLCEHEHLITLGRRASRAQVRLTGEQLRNRGVNLRWVTRSGGCVPHARGQLAIYPIVPLRLVGWTPAEYMTRLQAGIQAVLSQFRIHSEVRQDPHGVWGQSGLLAAIGLSNKQGTTMHGAFLNVDPEMNLFRHVDSVPGRVTGHARRAMSSMLAERRAAARMPSVRTAVIECLASTFDAGEYHFFAGHPWLPRGTGSTRESRACI